MLALTWGAHPENLPSLNIGFSNANNSYTVYGAGSRGTLHSNTFSLTSAYKVAGFNLNGGYQYTGYRTLTPEFLVNVPSQHTDSSANAFSFGVGHNLPWNGGFSAAATHLDISTDFGDTTSSNRFNTTIDTLTSTVNIAPRPHLSVGANTFYTDNLEGTLYNTLLTAGVTVPQNEGQQSSHDLSVTGYANYEMPEQHLQSACVRGAPTTNLPGDLVRVGLVQRHGKLFQYAAGRVLQWRFGGDADLARYHRNRVCWA